MDSQIDAILEIAHDYWSHPTRDSVEEWIMQFDADDRDVILFETTHLLRRFYYSKERTTAFFLRYLHKLQKKGALSRLCIIPEEDTLSSQYVMQQLFLSVLQDHFHMTANDLQGKIPLYIDDASLSGGVVSQRFHNNKQKTLLLHLVKYENDETFRYRGIKRKLLIFKQDQLLSQNTPSQRFFPKYREEYKPYVETLENSQYCRFRQVDETSDFFSSAQNRDIIEHAFTMAGITLCQQSYTKPASRPLGMSPLATLGFGSFFLTFRNIANNCPLAYWARTPYWKPLFPCSRREERYVS